MSLRPMAVLVMWLLLVPALDALAQRTSDLRVQEKALGKVRGQIREERGRVREAKEREASLLSELEGIERRLTAKRAEWKKLAEALRRTSAEVRRLEEELERLEQKTSGRQELLAQRLRTLYKLRSEGAIPVLLAGADLHEMAVRTRTLAVVASGDRRLLATYASVGRELQDRHVSLERERAKVTTLRGQAKTEQRAIDQEGERRRSLLARVREERATHERMVEELVKASRRLEALVQELQRRAAKPPPGPKQTVRLRPAPEPSAAPGEGFGALRGMLPWPTDGKVVSAYGPQVHPRFGTRTFRNGIDIEAPEGTQFKAVYPGTVLYTGWFKGYGNMIILDHGHGYYTLYAHASELRVREGESVRQGQIIGRVGETGSLAGPRLYFEVRSQGRPEDPQRWLHN
ncbi:MAG: peptidoglycan DD-metalloendopeptidase family protein [Candidatus Rokubacteria bacterium]|nr:peptidoglycan DD-metalloendopeptidase family protein [Candidatus Rokubacteria bacterium]